MASIGLLTQQTLGGVNFKSFSSALSFQCNILASAFGFFAILSAVPLVHRSFIECECDPSHVKKDIIETECLTGKLSSLVEEDRYVIQHNSYQDLPYLFVLFMLVNMIPTVICGELYSKRVLNTVKNMNNFNKHEDEGRASRLLDIFWNHLPDLAKNYLARLICEFFGLVSMAYQVYFWETTLNGVFSSWNYASSRSYYSIFPQIATCETTTIAPGGEEDKEYFKCILTMNRFYGASFKILAVLYAIGGLLQLMSLLCFTLLLLSPFRRLRLRYLLLEKRFPLVKRLYKISAPEVFFLCLLKESICGETFDLFLEKLVRNHSSAPMYETQEKEEEQR